MSNRHSGFWSLVQEADGKYSVIRIVFLLWAAMALFVWLGLTIKNGQVEDFPAPLAGIIAALAVGKAIQRFAENPTRGGGGGPATP
jgi:hypothetical protein